MTTPDKTTLHTPQQHLVTKVLSIRQLNFLLAAFYNVCYRISTKEAFINNFNESFIAAFSTYHLTAVTEAVDAGCIDRDTRPDVVE